MFIHIRGSKLAIVSSAGAEINFARRNGSFIARTTTPEHANPGRSVRFSWLVEPPPSGEQARYSGVSEK
jgi:hypothetical protein